MIREISRKTFWQLIFIYSFFILAVALGFLSKYTLYFNIFVLIIVIFGISILNYHKNGIELKISKKLHLFLFIIAIILILLFRIIPYIDNKIPLGYDTGLYKYGIEKGLINKDKWILHGGMEPGFLYLMKSLSFLFSTDILLKYVFIFFILLLGFAIYVFSREYFNKDVAIISILIYSLSLIQFKVFTYLYYKNIIALSLIFFSFYFLKKEKYIFFILSGILIGAIHRPSFYIFGLSYFFYVFSSPYKDDKYQYKALGKNILIGLIILTGALLFYLGDFKPAILSIISPIFSSFITPGESPGTFISFQEYQFSILFYLPFAILGLFWLIYKRKFDIFFFYTSILLIIVYFQFFFFNRFIIFLDIALIILSSLGFNILIKEKKNFGLLIILILFLSAGMLMYKESINTNPDLTNSIFNSIQDINISENAYIVSISSAFSPYLQGYTNNRIIAPGLFDYDLFKTEARWEQFWLDLNASELKSYYKEDIYLLTNKDLNASCYQKSSQNLYKWIC